MRLLLAALAAGAAALGGCSLVETCGSAGEPVRFPNVVVRAVDAPAVDTLTVVLVSRGPEHLLSPPFVTPTPSSGRVLRLTLDAERFLLGPDAPQFETAVRGDTVFVREVPALLRAACSPPVEYADYRVTAVAAPAGVRAVRVRTVWYEDVPFPASALPTVVPATRAPLFFTV